MVTATPTENRAAKTADEIFQGVVSVALPIAKAAEVAAVPCLGWPVISQLFDMVQNWIVNQIRIAISLQTTFLIIDFQTDLEKRAFLEAAQALRGQLSSPEANKAFDEAFNRLVQYNGSYSPK